MFNTIREIYAEVIKSVQNTGIFIGKELNKGIETLKETITSHTYQVEVKNPQEKVDVKGTVIVGNQAKLEKKIEEVNHHLGEMHKLLPTLKKVEVTNQKSFPTFPKSLEVSNLPKSFEINNFDEVVQAIDELHRSLSKLKLNPEIKVESPKIPAPVVNIPKSPAPVVKVEEKEVDLSALNDLIDFWQSLTKSAKKALSVRLTDGKQFYKAIDKFVETTANNPFPFVNTEGDSVRAVVDKNQNLITTVTDTWGANNTRRTNNTSYMGKEDVDGNWVILKIEFVDGNEDDKDLTYATVKNNPTISSYLDAWTDRATLVYGTYSQAF